MKYNYQIIIEYLGTKFVGWQIQKNGKSIQETVQLALSKTFNLKVKLIGSGRTDAGVHAMGQSANFLLDNKIQNRKKTLSTINFYLKKYPISVILLRKRQLKFNARFSAKKRVYEYFIVNTDSKLSIDEGKVWLVRKKLDIWSMKKAIKILIGTHDFSTFRSSSCNAKSPIRTITKASIKKINDRIILKFESRSFLQHQVRSMVGCLKCVGEKKWSIQKFKKVIKAKKRKFCAMLAPPNGLYLKKIYY